MKTSATWMYTVLPISALSGGLGVMIPLYILFMKGTVYDVGIATAIYALVEIPASIFWGNLTDKVKRTKLFILISVIGTFPILIILYLINSVTLIYSAYGLYSFVAIAASPAINILIIARRRNGALPKYFSRYSVLVIIGSLAGMIPGLFIDGHLIREYLIFLLAVDIIALLVAMEFISEIYPTPKRENKKEIKKSFGILNMISVTPHILTSHSLLKKIRSNLRIQRGKGIYLLLATISMFNLSMYLFNTSYIPYLYMHGVGYGGIFSVNISNTIAQLLIYTVVLSLIKGMSLKKYYKFSTVVRGTSYLVAVAPAFIFTGLFYQLNLAAYFIAGIGYAIWNVTSSVMLYERVRKMGPGHYIGLWVAVLGLSGVVGAFASGLISKAAGYAPTFFLSIIAAMVSLLVFIYLERTERSKHSEMKIHNI